MVQSGAQHQRAEVAQLILVLAERVRAAFTESLATFDLTGPQLHLLRRLQLDGPQPTRELAGQLGAEVTTVTSLADRLEQRGLIERQPDPRDRRVRRLVLTPDGDRLATVAWAATSDNAPVAALSAAQLAQLRALVHAMLGAGRDATPRDRAAV